MKKIDITLAICNFNKAEYLDRSIRSCLDQIVFGSKMIEVIVIDDNSSDRSKKVLKVFGKKIKLFSNKKIWVLDIVHV